MCNIRKQTQNILQTDLKTQQKINDNLTNNDSNSKYNHINWATLSDIDCQIFTRLHKQQISDIWIFLSTCKSNLSFRVASNIFGPSKTTISDIFHHVLDTLYEKLVPTQLGKTWTRAKITLHTPAFAKNLLQIKNGQIAFTCDGLPIYIQKSADFDIQKLTYSGKCKRNCITFHGCVTLDGTFIFLNGPYGSDGYNNDQNIFDSLFDKSYNKTFFASNNSNDNSNYNSNDNIDNDYLYDDDPETLHLSLKLTKDGDIIVLDRGTASPFISNNNPTFS